MRPAAAASGMSSTQRRDLVTCKGCGAELGAINRKHDHMTLRPGVAMLVILAVRVDIICPGCGHCRSLRPEQFPVVARAAKPPVLESA
jgi:hypothetical protein